MNPFLGVMRFVHRKKEERITTVVYQKIKRLDCFSISRYLKKNIPVSMIEPFFIHNHKNDEGTFPRDPSPYVQELIKKGNISLLTAETINAKEIYLLAAEMAVATVEAAYREYRIQNKKIIQFVSETLKSTEAEKGFKINLCNRLADFYSINIMLHRIEEHFHSSPTVAYLNINVYDYLLIKKLLLESNQVFYNHSSIRLPIRTYVTGFLNSIKEKMITIAMLGFQAVASGLLGEKKPDASPKKSFLYGITIISPRQFRENRRSCDFLVDNQKILAKEVVYFPMMPLSDADRARLANISSECYILPRRGKIFSNFNKWKTLLWLGFKQISPRHAEEIFTASVILFNYFKWKEVLENVQIKHFITHSDFGIGHIGRNIALNQTGVQTWYFIDSRSHGFNLRKEMNGGMRHPYWAYLHYDHLITWDAANAQYLKEHPGSFKQTHVTGCIWGAHIQEKNQARKKTMIAAPKDWDRFFVIACFDSTYLRNAHISYAGGIAFAEHIFQLTEEYADVYIIFKEKKERAVHSQLDPKLGPKLLETYERMSNHPRIAFYGNQTDASELISVSDMVITFPFISTTFEALSRNKPSIWHDPLGDFRQTLYGKIESVTTHGYDELKAKVLELKTLRPGSYQNPIPMNSPLIDPYRDGKAIDRFIELLTTNG